MRSIAVSLLAVLLFCGTSSASVCDLTCQLGRMQPICGAAAMEYTAAAMACDHCPGAMTVGDAAHVTPPCSPMVCGQMVVLAEHGADDVRASMVDVHGAVIGEVNSPFTLLVQEALRLTPPPLSGMALHPLSVSLRV